ncbi:hypothetical protein BGX20_002799, partial [Mortierella sp. AD010]
MKIAEQEKTGNDVDPDLMDIASSSLEHPTTNTEQEDDEIEDRASRGTETEDEEENESRLSDNAALGDDNIGDGAAGEASTAEGAEGIEKRKALLETRLRDDVRDTIRDSLMYDPYTSETAEAFGIPEDERITVDKENRLVFHPKANYFEDWKERHQVNIGTSFSPHGNPHTYSVNVHKDSAQSKKERAGQTLTYYDCH